MAEVRVPDFEYWSVYDVTRVIT